MKPESIGKKKLTKDSRYLSYLLRHHPEEANLTMDEQGWVSIRELIKNTGQLYTLEYLRFIVETDSKTRYAINETGTKIRANQGHSISSVNPDLIEAIPPDILYHGTAKRFVDSIMHTGITKQSRNLVHLSTDEDTAWKVGKRHGEPVVLVIDVQKMVKDNVKFYLSANNLWFTDIVDPEYIKNIIYSKN